MQRNVMKTKVVSTISAFRGYRWALQRWLGNTKVEDKNLKSHTGVPGFNLHPDQFCYKIFFLKTQHLKILIATFNSYQTAKFLSCFW